MKMLISLLLISSSAFAMDISSVPLKNEQGVYQINTVISCVAGDDSCQKLCGQAELCSRPEPICMNCAGTANELIRILFTRLDSFYQATMDRLNNEDLITYMNSAKYVLLSAQSVYNYHKPWDAPETLVLFQSFCQLPTVKPLLLLELDSVGQPHELKGVICQDENGSYAQKVQSRLPTDLNTNLLMELR